MSLQKRISLFFLLVAAIVIFTLYIASHYFILNSYTDLEQEKETETMKRVLAEISQTEKAMLRELDLIAASLSIPSQPEEAVFFTDEALLASPFTSVLIAQRDGTVLFQKKMNEASAISQSSAPVLQAFVQDKREALGRASLSGFYAYKGQYSFIAGKAVDGQDRMLLLAYTFHSKAMQTIRSETRLPVMLESSSQTLLPASAVASASQTRLNAPIWLAVKNHNVHMVSSVLPGINGEPAAVVSFEASRDIYLKGRQMIFLWLLLTVGVSVMLLATCVLLLNRLVFFRLKLFMESIFNIRSLADFSLRLPVKGKDEVAQLEHEFNRLLADIEQSRSHIMKLAYEDTLTHLPNRVFFYREVNRLLSRHEEERAMGAVLFMDLDGFKQVNDRYGHETGDSLLKHTARQLRDSLAENGIVSRLGGDEFILFLANVEEEQEASALAARLCGLISRPVTVNGCTVCVSASIGISFYPHHSTNLDTLISLADAAMFEAKRQGKNQYACCREFVEIP